MPETGSEKGTMRAGFLQNRTGRWWLKLAPKARLTFWQGQALAIGCLVVAILCRLGLTSTLGSRGAFFTFFPALMIASFWGGTGPGLTCLVLSAMIGDFFWLRPREGFLVDAADAHVLIGYVVSGCFILVICGLFKKLVEAHGAAEEQAVLLTREMRHRIRNLMSLVQAISQQTARRSKGLSDYQDQFYDRLEALGLALALDMTDNEALTPANLDMLVARVLTPFGQHNCQISGPPVPITPRTATPIALIIHELATNAVKYGALSVPEGRVEIGWRRKGPTVLLQWREIGGPIVTPPTTQGFGTRLISSAFRGEEGETEVIYDSLGVQCHVRFTT
jgi:two-component sensor histidine kinase